MAKEITATIKLQVPAGQATPAPPVGPALGQHGVNIGQFVSQFNERTRDQMGTIIPVIITVYKDRTFSFIMKSPPAAVLLKQAAGHRQRLRRSQQGQGRQGDPRAGSRDRAERKMADLNASRPRRRRKGGRRHRQVHGHRSRGRVGSNGFAQQKIRGRGRKGGR